MGKSAPKQKAGPLENQAVAQNAQLWAAGEPIRASVIPNAVNTLATQNPFSTALPGSARGTYEKQFGQAKNSIMNSAGGRGGMLRRALVDNANSRAGAIAKASDDYRQLGIERAMGLIPSALPNAAATMGGQQQLVSGEQARNKGNVAMQAQGQQATGEGIGSLAGLGMMAMMASSMF
jgi:hypothetical protein